MNTRLILWSSLALAVCACQNFQFSHYIADQNKQYISAKPAPALQVPANLNNTDLSAQQKTLPTLPVTDPSFSQVPSLLPPGSLSAQLKAGQVSPQVLKTPLPQPE